MNARPFLKWVGGKTQLLPTLHALMPASYNHYVEPFVGAGAMFFSLGVQNAFLSDANHELILTYKAIRDAVEKVIDGLSECEQNHSEEFFYKLREIQPEEIDAPSAAARMIYLNKNCYNGLYRVSKKKRRFNSPFGHYDAARIPAVEDLRACSHALANVAIEEIDFEDVLSNLETGNFCYCDPPYVPVSETADFTSYTADDFSWKDQERLASSALAAAERGAFVMLSNADVPEVRELYLGWDITSVQARRNINSKGSKRGPVGEVVIRSWIA